jgi:lipopolysaccharide/colanic/teichoic acid biosynthesis glycosyltransferase
MHAPLDGQAGGRAYSLYGAVKRCADFVIALIALLMLLPLFVGVAILIKVDSPGPVLFSQRREGRAGRVFRCWKFRTMVAHADAQQRALYVRSAVDGPQFKIEHDPRVTRVGHGLRKTNIDELPQLINVLLGQMSLIGPRPSPFRENQICVPWRQARLSVRPGITGLWQICRHERDAGDFHQWIYFDILYVRHLSWSLDLRIFVGTLLTCGGRWSVPLAKLIPGERLSGVDRAAALACAQAGYHRARVQTPAVPCAYPLGRPA